MASIIVHFSQEVMLRVVFSSRGWRAMTYGLVRVCVRIYGSLCVCGTRVCTGRSVMFCGLGCLLYSSAVQWGGGGMHLKKNKQTMHARWGGKPRLYSGSMLQIFSSRFWLRRHLCWVTSLLFALPPSHLCLHVKSRNVRIESFALWSDS